jgi:hypothetical protein
MQATQEQIKRQQEILKLKGFYSGVIDGIWGPKCIEAKSKYETDRAFAPGLPNRGLPFADQGPYPKGLYMGRDKLLTCAEYEQYAQQKAETETKAKTQQQKPVDKQPTVQTPDSKEQA